MTVYAITDTKKGRTGIAPTYLQTTQYKCCSRCEGNDTRFAQSCYETLIGSRVWFIKQRHC